MNFSTRVRCFENEFDKVNFRIKGNVQNAYDKNLIIDKILARINDVLVKYRLRNKKITRTGFFNELKKAGHYQQFLRY